MAAASIPAQPADFRAILLTWPDLRDVASDLGINPHTVAGWRTRRFIPEKYWASLEEAAARRGYADVTYERCRQAAAACRRERQANAEARNNQPRRTKADDDADAGWFTAIIGSVHEALARAEERELGPCVRSIKEDTFRCQPPSFPAKPYQHVVRARRHDTED